MHSMRLVGFVAMVIAVGGEARGEDAGKALFERAQAQFALHHFDEAAALFEKSFEQRPDPALLYNAAQAHRLAGNKRRALELYESLLRQYGDRLNRAELEDLTQCHQRAETAGATRRRRRNRKHAPLKGRVSWVAPLAHARHPVDGIFEHWRYRRTVFGTSDKDAMMSHDHLFELERVGGLTTTRVERNTAS